MSFERRMKRKKKLAILNKRIGELLEFLELSKSQWKKESIRVEGSGINAKIAQTRFKMTDKVKWGRHMRGHKPSRVEQYSVLFDLCEARKNNQALLDELQKRIEESKETENG